MFAFLKTKKKSIAFTANRYTSDMPVESIPLPEKIILPMLHHQGKPAIPQVKKGDSVQVGTLIGKAMEEDSAHIHSGVSGTVSSVLKTRTAEGGIQDTVVIIPDGKQTPSETISIPNVTNRETFLSALKESGIVGLEGNKTHCLSKFTALSDEIDYLCINGTECEPYLTSDQRVMLEQTDFLFQGITAIQTCFSIDTCILAVTEDNEECIEHLETELEDYLETLDSDDDISIKPLPLTYPQGAEPVLLAECLDIHLEYPDTATDYDILFLDVSTVAAIGKYLATGIPLVSRILTVDGDNVTVSNNLEVIIGTPIAEVLQYCEGLINEEGKIIDGDAMTGHCVADLQQPILKSTRGLLVFSEEMCEIPPMGACIHCGRCVQACPASLAPRVLALAAQTKNISKLEKQQVSACLGCGTCSYVCPSKRPVSQCIVMGKRLVEGSKP